MQRTVLAIVVLAAGACREVPKPEGRPAPVGLPPVEGAAKAASPHGGLPPASPHGGAQPASPQGDLPPNHPPIDPHQRTPEGTNIDPTQVLEGSIEVAPELRDQVKTGDVIFVSAKPIDPATGQIVKTTLAVARLEVAQLPMAFRLSGANAMSAGAAFKGEVAIIARVDRDRDAISRAPGDIEGTLRVTIPAKGLKLVLDTPVQP